MRSAKLPSALLLLLSATTASAAEHGRIKRGPPTPQEADRIVSDMAMNDALLQKGDIVVTDRGFLRFRGWTADGANGDFIAIPDPLSPKK